MSTQRLEFKPYSLPMPTGKLHAVRPPYAICISVRVRAETRRLFQALVVPEYLETWLRIPEEDACSIAPMEEPKGFILQSSNPKAVRIEAGYSAWRRRRLSICWRLEKNRLVRESNVAMRLIGDFECSVLSLCHTGLGSFEEFAWHRRLWTESLERLTKLFQGDQIALSA
jgi:uncharacterized protein YndB with AHSA1/START domain